MKFVGSPLSIPSAAAVGDAVQKQYVDALGSRVTTLEAAGGGLKPVLITAPATSAYTASPGDFVQVTVTGGGGGTAITVTLPDDSPVGSVIAVKKAEGSTGRYVSLALTGDSHIRTLYFAGQSVTFVKQLATGGWRSTSTTGSYRNAGFWSSTLTYSYGDIVSYQGRYYILATAQNTGTAPNDNVAYAWYPIDVAGSNAPVSAGDTSYTAVPGDVIRASSNAADTVITLPNTTSQFLTGSTITVAVQTVVPGYKVTIVPASGAQIVGGAQTVFDSFGTATFSLVAVSQWQQISASGVPRYRGTWSSSKLYSINDIVTSASGTMYVAIAETDSNNVGQVALTNTLAWTKIASQLPAGGTTGQVLTKNSGTDYDISWATAASGGTVSGGATTPTTKTDTDYTAAPGDYVIMTGLTANRNLTLPTAAPAGSVIAVHRADSTVGFNVSIVDASSSGNAEVGGMVLDQPFQTAVFIKPASGSYWQYYSFAGGVRYRGAVTAATTSAFFRNDVVRYQGTLLLCVTNGVSGSFTGLSNWQPIAAFEQPTRITAAAYTARAGDHVLADATSNAQTITLPTSTDNPQGTIVTVRKIDTSANAVTVAFSGGSMDATAPLVLTAQGQSVSFIWSGAFSDTGVSNGSTWYLLKSTGGMRFRGTWGSGVQYATGDVVMYTGRQYVWSSTRQTGAVPGTDANWISLASLAPNGIPTGGTTGQVLAKASATSYDTVWTSPSSGGGLTPTTKLTSTSATYTAAASDLVLVDATAGAFTLTLPTTSTAGTQVGVKKIDPTTNIVTVIPPGGSGKTIDGDASCTLNAPEAAATFVYDGTNWQIVNTAVVNSGTDSTQQLILPTYRATYWYDRRSPYSFSNQLSSALPGAAGTAGIAQSTTTYAPFFAHRSIVIDTVGVMTGSTAPTAASTVTISVYSATAANLPGVKLSSSVVVSPTAANIFYPVGLSTTIPKGWCYFGLTLNATSVGSLSTTSATVNTLIPNAGWPSTPTNATSILSGTASYYETGVTPPSTATPLPVPQTTAGAFVPNVWFRVVS